MHLPFPSVGRIARQTDVTALRLKYYRDDEHPYRLFESQVSQFLGDASTVVDLGCGRTAPVLSRFVGKARTLIGVDVVDGFQPTPGITWVHSDLAHTGLPSGSVDIVFCRSVMEHVRDPTAAYKEIMRILKPGGHFAFLTPNLFDYSSLIACAIPNRLHPWIVSRTEGRDEQDVFPVLFRANTRRAVVRLARTTGFAVSSFQYLGQYPAYLMFSPSLFLIGTAYDKAVSRVSGLAWLRGWIMAVLRKPET